MPLWVTVPLLWLSKQTIYNLVQSTNGIVGIAIRYTWKYMNLSFKLPIKQCNIWEKTENHITKPQSLDFTNLIVKSSLFTAYGEKNHTFVSEGVRTLSVLRPVIWIKNTGLDQYGYNMSPSTCQWTHNTTKWNTKQTDFLQGFYESFPPLYILQPSI